MAKIPYILVVGADDLEHTTVGVNRRGVDAKPERGVPLIGFVDMVADEVARRVLPEAPAEDEPATAAG